jgi:hypothetical protein
MEHHEYVTPGKPRLFLTHQKIQIILIIVIRRHSETLEEQGGALCRQRKGIAAQAAAGLME